MSAKKTVSGALATKRRLRAQRPRFGRHASHRKARLDSRWKRPRGLHNKQRDTKKGSSPSISDGWRTPTSVRGLHSSGLVIVHVSRPSQLEVIDNKSQAVVISAVGGKRQHELLQACMKLGLKVLNHKPEQRVKLLEERLVKRKAHIAQARKDKEAAKAKVMQTEKKPELSEEDKKKAQDKIKEEVLTSGNTQ